MTDITATAATIRWSLDEPATGQVEYGLDTDYGSRSRLDPSFDSTVHEHRLTGLDPDTAYHFQVVSEDRAGNRTAPEDEAFRTEPEPTPTLTPTPEPTPKPTPGITPEPSLVPEPSAEPEVTPEPSLVPEPSAEPEVTPEPSLVPILVPDIVGKPEAEALIAFEEAGLLPGDRTETHHDAVIEGAVIGSEPVAGIEVEAGSTVAYVVSAGPEPVAALEPEPGPTIHTNADDYAPGALVLVFGEGWVPDESIDLFVNDHEGKSWSRQETIVADEAGGFIYSFRLPEWFVAVYTIVATGEESGQASTQFTDAIGTGDSTGGDNGGRGSSELTIATPVTFSGEVLLANVSIIDLGANIVCTPAGWSSVAVTTGTGITVASFYRVAIGGEAASYTWQFRDGPGNCGTTNGTVNASAIGGIISYSGIDTSSPIRTIGGASGSGTALAAPDVAGAFANDTVVRHFGSASSPTITSAATSSTGVANSAVYSRSRNRRVARAAAAADADQPGSGNTGSLAASGGNAAWAAQTIVLRALQPTITLTIADQTAEFGTNLTPDGEPSDSTDPLTTLVANRGACYYWTGRLRVESTVDYRIELTGEPPAGVRRVDFHPTPPTTVGECGSGEQVDRRMYKNATPPSTWLAGQSATAGQDHGFGLGLDVRWTDAPDPNLGDATLTLTVVAE